MAKLGGIYVDVRARTDKYKRDLAKAKTFSKKAVVVMQKQFNSINFKQAGLAALAFGATVAFGMKKAIDAASNLEETVGKFDVVFAEHGQQAQDMAKILVESYAMSTREAKQYLSSVQDLLVPMGMASDAAIVMSNEVVKLSADLASFNNVPTATAMADIQSALVGNFETMKKYGVVLNETVIKQEALNQELWDGKGMVNANVKAYIAFNLMLKGSAAAIGDQQRTMGSYANQMKQLKANIEDISATIGNELLPQVTEYIKQINIAIKQNPKMISDIAFLAKTLLDFAAAIGKVSFKMLEWHNNVVKSLQAIKLASAGVITWTGALLHGVEIIDAINESQKGLMHTIDNSTEGFNEYAKAVANANKVTVLTKPPPSVGAGKAKKEKKGGQDLISGLFEPIGKDEFERDQEMFQQMEDAAEARLAVVATFNESYAELGLDRFELERLQLERMTEIYKEAGVEKNRIDKMVATRSSEIARAEMNAKLDIYSQIAGGAADSFMKIAQAGGESSKKSFAAFKAFAMVQAGILGVQSVLQALASAPPPYSFILAGVAGAAAAIQVAQIADAQPPSYEVGTPFVPQTGLAMLHQGERVITKNENQNFNNNNGQEQRTQEVNIVNVTDTSQLDRYMASSRGQNAIINSVGNNQKFKKMLTA